jgi:3-oxoacyl-[acyl-carrier protein] reductase
MILQPLAMQQPAPLAGRVAIVTGVSRRIGIGFAIASRLAQLGAELFLHAWAPYDAAQPWGADPDGVAALARDLRRYGRHVEVIEADFRDAEAPASVVRAAVNTYNYVDILVANHAYSAPGALVDLSAEHIDRHLEANVRGTLLLVQAFAAQHDDTRPGGRVILMTSGQHHAPMPGELAYAASKGALHQLTRSLAAHLAPRHITVNTIDPGATDTGYAVSDVFAHVLADEPQGRWGVPDDAARLIAWLASDDAKWVTGQVISSTGGGP